MSGGKINFSTSNLKFDVDNYSQYTSGCQHTPASEGLDIPPLMYMSALT